jgi:spore coat protein U-like protein
MRVSRRRARPAVLLASVLAGVAAPAAKSAVAAPACHASVTLVDFGRVDYKDGGDITGQLTVTCDGPTAFEVSASPGYGSYQGRTMHGPSETVLRYNLYVDPARQRVWGDGDSGGTARITGQSDGRKAVTYTIYGRIPDGQPVRSGRYYDSVKVTVSR